VKIGPGVFVLGVIATFGAAIFPPLGVFLVLLGAGALLVKWANARASRKARRAHAARMQAYYVRHVADQQPVTNPGWRL
jgi:hypothetical protein